MPGPSIPGVTTPAPYEGEDLPAINDALAKETAAERATELLKIAEKWFEAWQWYYDECIQTQAMLGGAQFGYWSEEENRWVGDPEPETADHDVVRLQANIEKRIVDQAVGMLTQDDPIFGFAPGSSETGDSAAAKAADGLGRWIWQFHRRGSALERKAKGAFAFGLVPELVQWDSSDGEPYIKRMVPQEPFMGEDGNPVQPKDEPEWGFKGDLRFTTLHRDQVAFDVTATHPYDGEALFVRERVSRSRAMRLYPDKIKSKPSKSEVGSEGGERRVARFSTHSGKKGTGEDGTEDAVVLITAFIRRCPRYPFGQQIVLTDAGDPCDERENEAYPTWEEIQNGEQQPNYHWPIVFYVGDERDGCPWGRGRPLDIHGLQKTINGDLSKGVQHRAVIGNTKIVLPVGLDVEWNDDIGQIIRTKRPGQKADIGYLTSPPMPSDTIPAVNLQRELMEAIPGINAATMGNAPSADPSGRAISALQQRDYIGLGPMKRGLYRSAAMEMELSLRLFRRYAEQKRKLVIVGKNGDVDVAWLDRSSIAAGTDVVCFNATSLPQDPEKRALYLMNLSTMLAQLPDDQQRFFMLELLNLHDTQAWFQKQAPFRQRATRICERLLLGESPKLLPWDNMIVMKAALDEFACKRETEVELESVFAQMQEQQQAIAQQQQMAASQGMPMLPAPPPQPDPASLFARFMPLWEEATQKATLALQPPPPPQAPPGTVPGASAASPASTQAPPSEAPPATPGTSAQAA